MNGAEKVLTLRTLTKTDVRQLTTSALPDLLDPSLVLLEVTSTLLLAEIPVKLALPVNTVQEWLDNLIVPLVGNQLEEQPLVSLLLPVLQLSQERQLAPVNKLLMASGTTLVPSSLTK